MPEELGQAGTFLASGGADASTGQLFYEVLQSYARVLGNPWNWARILAFLPFTLIASPRVCDWKCAE